MFPIREIGQSAKTAWRVVVSLLAVGIALLLGLINWLPTTVVAVTIIVAAWFRWEQYLYQERYQVPVVGGMISCWQNTPWSWEWQTILWVAFNLLFDYRLAFLLPLAWLCW